MANDYARRIQIILSAANAGDRQRLRDCLRATMYSIKVQDVADPRHLATAIQKNLELDFIVISDQSLKKRIQTIRLLKENTEILCPPIVCLVTRGEASGSELPDLLAAGCDGVILEPLTVDTLNSAIKHLLLSEAYTSFQSARDLAILKITISSACNIIDRTATIFLDTKKIAPPTLLAIGRLKKSVEKSFSKTDLNSYLQYLSEMVNSHLPFESKMSEEKKREAPKIVAAAKVVTKIMEVRSINSERLAQLLHMDLPELRMFLDETAPMTKDLAEKFARVLGHDKNYWMRYVPEDTSSTDEKRPREDRVQ